MAGQEWHRTVSRGAGACLTLHASLWRRDAPRRRRFARQVHRLIKEAAAHENLSALYIGWMPFL